MNEYTGRDEILKDLEQRVEDKILEPSNYDLLKKLVENADTLDEAIKIAELGTTYRRTGFHFDKKLEKQSDTISYFKKNEELSFTTDPDATTHKLVIGDNYPALLNLLVEYKGKVDVIYIDPPYGKDSMGEFAQTNYENAISRDNLLSMFYPRLWLAKQLLSDNGVIFCSIDDRNQAYVRGLFDEVFGEGNFIASVIWQSKRGRDNSAKFFSKSHEYLHVYSRSKATLTLDKIEMDETTKKAYRNPDNDPRGEYRLLGAWARGTQGGSRYEFASKSGKTFDERLWLFAKPRMLELDADDRLVFVGDKVYRKLFISEHKGSVPETIWSDTSNAANAADEVKSIFGTQIFDTVKPTPLIKRILKIAIDKNSVVLDFFSGSGTTGQAVLELNKEDGGNRQFILVTNNEVTSSSPNGIAYDVTSRRLKRVMTGEDYDGDNNFKWLEKNKPLGDNLLVVDLAEVANFEATEGKTPFDVIDETLYGQEKLSVSEKIEWVAKNFEQTQKRLEEK